MVDRVQLARQLGYVAQHLDAAGYVYAGVVRQGARVLLEPDQPDDGCAGCGKELQQPATGRRRKWCDEPCRRQHRP